MWKIRTLARIGMNWYANRYILPKLIGVNIIKNSAFTTKNRAWEKWMLVAARTTGKRTHLPSWKENTKKYINTTALKEKRHKKRSENEDSYTNIKEERRSKKTRAAHEHQISQITEKSHTSTRLKFVTFSIKEIKKDEFSFWFRSHSHLNKDRKLKSDINIRRSSYWSNWL